MSYLSQDQNTVEPVTLELPENDIVNRSIQRIVDEILEDIARIFIREELFDYECEMILEALKRKIRKSRRKRVKEGGVHV